jgi:tetratricopeptide (TPR) repeat protein
MNRPLAILALAAVLGPAIARAAPPPLSPAPAAQADAGGDAALSAGKYAQAERDYDAAVKLAPGTAEYLADRGEARRLLGDAKAAVDDLTAAISLDARTAWFRVSRGRALEALGEDAKACRKSDVSM